MQNFRRLHVWERAQRLAKGTRDACGYFPRNGFGSLRMQMVRSAESILFNIAEGCGASSQKEFARFLSISSKSSMELETQLELAKSYGILSIERLQVLTDEVVGVRRMIWGLRRKVLAADEITENRNR